jgi:16S rRNA (guanine(966)-N(2))-methyltransferase RsmD
MRITGGSLKGRQVKVPDGIIRPAMDKIRESVFAVLGDLSGFSFLDIFTGSGIIALEAASRGAEYIEAVEMDPKKRRTLLENVQISPVRINCRFMPAELYVKRAKRPFDLIFLDPPFPYQYKWDLIKNICSSALVKEATLILLHRPREDAPEETIPGIIRTDSRVYGRSVIEFYKFSKKS